MDVSYDRIDEFERTCDSKEEFEAYLISEDYDEETVASLLEEYGYE